MAGPFMGVAIYLFYHETKEFYGSLEKNWMTTSFFELLAMTVF
jgi:hypothetical protein